MTQNILEVEINAPVDKVFEYVSDVETHPKYAEFIKTVEITSSIKRGVGVVFYQQRVDGIEKIKTEIVKYIPNEQVTWITQEENGGSIHVDYKFFVTEKGTRVVHTLTSEKFADPERKKRNYDENVTELKNLKRILEV